MMCICFVCLVWGQMLEKLNGTLEEEKRIMRDQMDKVMAQNQELLMRTLDSKDQAIVEERIFKSVKHDNPFSSPEEDS